MVTVDLPKDAVGLDIITSLRAISDDSQKAILPDAADFQAKIDGKKKSDFAFSTLRSSLPSLERKSDITRFRESKKSVLSKLWGGGIKGDVPDGFKVTNNAVKDLTTVSYIANSTSSSIVSELALLKVATLARENDRKGFIIVDRKDRTRTVTKQYNSNARPYGYLTELTVRFLDQDIAAGDIKFTKDRFINANDVYNKLAPVYIVADETG